MMEGFTEDEAKIKVNVFELPSLANYKDWHETVETDLDKDVFEKCSKVSGQIAYEKTDKDTYQAMEGLIHNLNTMHSRAGRAA